MSKNKRVLRITALIVVFSFFFSFARPLSVYAQDEQPVEPTPTEEVTPPVEEPTTIPEIIEQLPQDVELVVQDQAGEELPLASEEASDVLKGLTGKTAVFTCVGNTGYGGSFASISLAMTAMTACVNNGGTVGGSLTLSAGIFNETIEVTDDISYMGFTSIYGAGSTSTVLNNILVSYQTGNLIIQGLNALGTDGITLATTGSITVKDVKTGDSTILEPGGTNDGFELQAGTGGINVTNSGAYHSYNDGFTLLTDGDIKMENVIVSNAGMGIDIIGADNVTINNAEIHDTNVGGLVWDNTDAADWQTDTLHVTDAEITNTSFDGLSVTHIGTITVDSTDAEAPSQFSNNSDDGYGIYMDTVGDVTISDVEASNNSLTGIYISGAQSVKITDTVAQNNALTVDCYDDYDCNGLTIQNAADITIDGGTYSGNAYAQIGVDNANLYDDNSDPIAATVDISNVTLDGSVPEEYWWDGTWGEFSWDNLRIGGNYVQDVTITDVTTRNSYCDGIYAWSSDQVDLSGIAASHNGWGDSCTGTYLEDFEYVTVSDSTYENNYIGLYLYDGNDGSVTDSTFTDNGIEQEEAGITYGSTGISLEDLRNVTIENTTISNSDTGINVYVMQDLEIAGVQINGSDSYGIDAGDLNNLTITGSEITGGEYGVYTDTVNNITIEDTTIDNIDYSGLYFDVIYETVTLTNVKVMNSGETGLVLNGMNGATDLMINCSAFEYNGVETDNPGFNASDLNNVTLAGVTYTGNGSDGTYNYELSYAGSLLELSGCITEAAPTKQPGVSGHIVSVTSGQSVAVDCGYGFTSLVLGTGDTVAFDGFCGSDAAFTTVESGSLPGTLTDGWTFISAYTETVAGAADGVIPEDGSAELNLVAGGDPANLSVLYWDAGASAWVEIPVVGSEGSFSTSNPAYKVLTGVTYTAEGTARFSVNFTGTFVVVLR